MISPAGKVLAMDNSKVLAAVETPAGPGQAANPLSALFERARQLGWTGDEHPEINRLDQSFAATLGFGQSRRLGILPA